jgi:membrane associated rhomboid family serine protease
MLEDRHYMRSDYEGSTRWTASPTIVLLVINTLVFALQCVNRVYLRSPIEGEVALSAEGLRTLKVWQLFTFQFLHADFLHFLCNGLGLYMLGRPVERSLGRGRFWEIYFASGTAGGLLQGGLGLLVPQHFGWHTVGASAGVCGLLAAFCLMYRDETIRVMFVLPVRAWNVLIASLVIAAFFVLVPSEPGVAHAAHLGGMLATIGYFRWLLAAERRLFDWRPYADAMRAQRREEAPVRRKKPLWSRAAASETQPRRATPEEFISKEVDPILDKISKQGIHSLTDDERRVLQAARTRMEQR